MISKIILITVLAIGANCLYLPYEYSRPIGYVTDFDLEQPIESVHPILIRDRRQVHGVANTNPDGTANIMAKLPLAGNDKNILSAIGSVQGVKPGGSFGAASGGLALDNVNGHGLSLTGKHIPDFGNQLTAAGKLNLLHTDKHDFNANAFATRNLPSNPAIPNFNTYGGGVDYTFNQKVGASLGMAHTPLLQKTDYSAMGNLNLFRNPTSSLDFSAGAAKSVSPFIPNRSWQPNFGLSFSKYF
ncbi:attacin [Danaus plexippus plexippus]|uniref:Attacin n=1 Tax=Danaus plexippus plexippus TaxID=278856 RepID=A0A212FKX9_DANPL|nr:defense protein 3-like isoform X1 [Danaus plexippus plexippus]XP_032522090.1 defense protein 3-like isoform X2 [Danaus plexippus plexippus]OWR54405.1 attacin [Danaus plexippus plexippus]